MSFDPSNLRGAKAKPLTTVPDSQLAQAATHPPPGDNWLHEIKYDGYRMACRVSRRIKFVSRSAKDWTSHFDSIIPTIKTLDVSTAVFDGEMTVLKDDGVTDFQALQNTIGKPNPQGMIYFVFDLLYLNGYNLVHVPLLERKQLLHQIIPHADGCVRYAEHIVGNGEQVFQGAARLGVEGIICKHVGSKYLSGRQADWLKVKCVKREEFVVVGYNYSETVNGRLGAIVVAEFAPDGQLRYAGRVGSGFSDQTLESLLAELKAATTSECPLKTYPPKLTKKQVKWVVPQMVVQVQYANRTTDGTLRHATFKGVHVDVSPSDLAPVDLTTSVVTETARAADAATEQTLAVLGDLRLTNPDRVMFPDCGVTKLSMAAYYASIADWILPEIVNRPLSLVRGPDGLSGKCFFQKRAPKGLSDSVERIQVEKSDGEEAQRLLIHDLPGLLALVQFSVMEFHIWHCVADRVERPDRFVIDLDPHANVPWSRTVQTALETRELLESIGLQSFVKTTGGSGLHIVVPISRRHDWEQTRDFANAVGEKFAARAPNHRTLSHVKAARENRIYIDIRAGRGLSSVCPYSVRARPGAPVSVPLSWDELPLVRAGNQFTMLNLVQRLQQLDSDPWEEIHEVRQSIGSRVLSKLSALK